MKECLNKHITKQRYTQNFKMKIETKQQQIT